MTVQSPILSLAARGIEQRADDLFTGHIDAIRRRVDRLMAGLMAAQWVFAVVIAIAYSPYAWEGKARSINPHVWGAVFLGGLLSALPIALALLRPGAVVTRQVIAVAQMLWSALLIHLTGGRIETHFHVFGSLAFLAFYRDPFVLLPATVVVAVDHVVRQVFWPESVFGVPNPESWRFLEHAGWVVFEDIFLVTACIRGLSELRDIATKRAELEVVSEEERRKSVALDAALHDALAAKATAEKANEVKSQFLANMSHELRTPINGVLGMTELVRSTEVTSKQRHYLETIARCGGMLLSVVNDILDFSKVEAGKLTMEKVEFEPAAVIHAVTELVATQASAKNIEVLCALPRNFPPRLVGDPARLQQILNNLVANAIKFTEHGEVEVRARVSDQSSREVTLRFEVRDTGIGIDAEHCAKVFQPFVQVDGSNSRKHGGTGLGLTIARELAQMMGGEIGVESEPGKGSVFWFTARFERVDADVVDDTTPAAARACRLLVVDDNATNRAILDEQLASSFASVECADGGASALAMLRAAVDEGRPYGLVLTDMQMPAMDGLAFTRALRNVPGCADVPVVLLSSAGIIALSDAPKQAGIAACLVKPAQRAKLLGCLFDVILGQNAGEASESSPIVSRGSSRPRVLLAEDNPVNQEIAAEMLAQLGCDVDLASDGRQALEVLARGAYAAVLMDCQMPELDGYEATRQIRRTEAAAGSAHVPVIAVTAHAMTGERERALAAGMDDYLSKPFSRDQLARAVGRWVRLAPAEAASDGPAAPPDAKAASHALDPSVRRSKNVLQLCLTQLPQSVTKMRDAIAGGEIQSLKEEAHRLKGSCLSIGAPRLADLCLRIEAAPERAAAMLDAAATDFADVREQLEHELVTQAATNGTKTGALHG